MSTNRRTSAIEGKIVGGSTFRRAVAGGPIEGDRDGMPTVAIHQRVRRGDDVLVTRPDSSVNEGLLVAARPSGPQLGRRVVVRSNEGTAEGVIASPGSGVLAHVLASPVVGAIATMVQRAAELDDWRDGTSVASPSPKWLTVFVAAARLTAERLTAFVDSRLAGRGGPEHKSLVVSCCEIRKKRVERGARLDSEQRIQITEARANRALPIHLAVPGAGVFVRRSAARRGLGTFRRPGSPTCARQVLPPRGAPT